MKIAIRADGGNRIGMGHIMRSLVLATELANTNDVFYVCRNSEEFQGGINKVKQEGLRVETIISVNPTDDLLKIKADILITDSYDVDDKYFSLTKQYFNKTIYIDDMNDKYYDVDFIINQNIGTENWDYAMNPNCRALLGTQYTLLRKEFRLATPINVNKNVSDILITMGGADPLEATKKIFNMVKDLDFNFHFVIGKHFKDIDFFKKLENSQSNLEFYFDPKIIDVMSKCDLAIAACGSTVYELASLGIPTIGTVVADNQERIAQIGHDEGILVSLGHIVEINEQSLGKCLVDFIDYNFRCKMQYDQLIKINKNGVNNIIKAILNS